MTAHSSFARTLFWPAVLGLALLLGGCGMKGPLRHPAPPPPPPADATLTAPPTVAPTPETNPVPAYRP